MDLMEPERDPDGCVRIDGQDCVDRNEPCPPPGWCPASTAAFDDIAARMAKVTAWAFALVLKPEDDGGPEALCPHEPRRRGSACP